MSVQPSFLGVLMWSGFSGRFSATQYVGGTTQPRFLGVLIQPSLLVSGEYSPAQFSGRFKTAQSPWEVQYRLVYPGGAIQSSFPGRFNTASFFGRFSAT